MDSSTAQTYMKMALELAKKGQGYTSPNPMVGAVLVKGHQVIGEGFHKRYGGVHAEVEAIRSATTSTQDSTLFCSLEPCSHTKKQTPPCTKAIIEAGIKEVYFAAVDPNPQVCGEGAKALTSAGIKVHQGLLAEEAQALNVKYNTYMQKGRPFITLKWAQTLDGKVAELNGRSQWITGEEARKYSHFLRGQHDAICVGSKTALMDNPKLTIRHGEMGKQPWRIVVGNYQKIPLTHHLLNDEYKEKTILCTDLQKLLEETKKRNISSILVEGGPTLISSLLKEKLADHVAIFLAAKILGQGLDAVELPLNLDTVIKISQLKVTTLGKDFVLEGPLKE